MAVYFSCPDGRMIPDRYRKFRAMLDRRQPDLTVLTDQVHKSHNLSAIIRTCDAVGVHDLHLTQTQKQYRAFRGRAMGSHKYVNIHHHHTIEGGIDALKQKGFRIYAAHFSDRAVAFYQFDYTQPSAIMLGAEKRGISPEGAALADEHIIIPMQGMVASFNVSVAAAVILVEAQRQRLEKGFYDTPRLPEAVYTPTLFRWGYPELARYCDERGLQYPDVDSKGQLVNPAGWYSKIKSGKALD